MLEGSRSHCPSWIYKRRSGLQCHILISGIPVELPGITLQIHTYLFASALAVSINVARIFSPFVACTLYTDYLPCESRFLWTNVWSPLPPPRPLRFRRFLDVVVEFRWKPSVQVSQCSYLLSLALRNFQLSSDSNTIERRPIIGVFFLEQSYRRTTIIPKRSFPWRDVFEALLRANGHTEGRITFSIHSVLFATCVLTAVLFSLPPLLCLTCPVKAIK